MYISLTKRNLTYILYQVKQFFLNFLRLDFRNKIFALKYSNTHNLVADHLLKDQIYNINFFIVYPKIEDIKINEPYQLRILKKPINRYSIQTHNLVFYMYSHDDFHQCIIFSVNLGIPRDTFSNLDTNVYIIGQLTAQQGREGRYN